MKTVILTAVFLFCAVCTWTPALSFFTEAELESYNVLVKPYGLDLTKLIPTISPNVWTCIKNHGELQTCNSTSLSVTSNISSGELKSMFDKCPAGQLGCFQSQTNSSSPLQGVLNRLLKIVKQMCSDQCWKKLAFVSRNCIAKNVTGVKATDQNALQFISEVLDATCLTAQIQGPTCAEKTINTFLDIGHMGDPARKVCNVSESLNAKRCTSVCYQELQQFHKNLGCCVGSVRDTIKCYNISTKEDSFGVFVMNSYSLCHLEPPKACKGTRCLDLVPTTSTTSTTSTTNTTTTYVWSQTSSKITKSSHHNATKIAGICIAVLVIVVGLLVMARFIHQRIKRREKVHLEDYGYSRLKMMEDDLYNDFTDDSDFEGFVAM